MKPPSVYINKHTLIKYMEVLPINQDRLSYL